MDARVVQLMADMPRVHVFDGPEQESSPNGVWFTHDTCYDLIARHCGAGMRTLETGIGISTALFVMLGTHHTCVPPFQNEIDALARYLDECGIDHDRVRFEQGWSDEVLPRLEPTPLDLVFIDGGYGFPSPTIDWYYAGSRLVPGGVLILDDRNLPAVAGLEAAGMIAQAIHH
jgi:predicted O-methyltransferase YrrM